MSKFATKIPVNTEALKQLLPAGAYVHGAAYDQEKNAVILTWEHGQLHTGYSFPVEFTQNELAAGVVPNGVTDLRPSTSDLKRIEVMETEQAEQAEAQVEVAISGEPPKPKRKKGNA